MTICFINGKLAVINGLRKLRNPHSWLGIFIVVSFNKIPPFCKNFIIFIISFILLYVRVILEPVINEIPIIVLGNEDNPLINGPVSSYRENPPDCIILDNSVFENVAVAGEPFAKALRIFETCVLVDKNLWRQLFLSLELPIKFDERFKVTPVPFFIAGFSLLSC